ncbi:MAG TPA: sugar-binding transcriptional regulator [Geminicoccus sp.]|uniref:sugar-binding transcriptional regulator n=1 Tax=Geminicoccus sp. TaxID=2024832 RepID=UPI002B7E1A12|nr:sugar-binding transcriptional regulator [Geminicoccus sp.]HWL69555.1 sugar-binding transcriptional regulator [Geminicoccus sp.]
MFSGEASRPPGGENSLATRAAWLSFIGGLTQDEIASRLSMSRVKVNRLIAQAHREGLIRVFIEGTPQECVTLEDRLCRKFGLSGCFVAPMLGEDERPLPVETLAVAGARVLHNALETGQARLIGVGHGRTLAAMADRLPRQQRDGVRFVSLLGSLTRNAAANPFDVIHRLCERTGAESYFLPVPFFADNGEDKAVLMAQRSVRHALDLGRQADLVIAGLGEVASGSFLVRTGMITAEELDELRRLGAVGEILGRFFDANGRLVDAEINARAIAIDLADLQGKEVVILAGGRSKPQAIRAILSTGLVTRLVTDEATAHAVIEAAPQSN